MNSKSITTQQAIVLLERGEKIAGFEVDFEGEKIKAIDAFKLGKGGIDVPEEFIEYKDEDVAYDPEVDEYERERVDYDPLSIIKEQIDIKIKIDSDIKAWIQSNDIKIDRLVEELVKNFYATNKLIQR